MGSPSPYLRGRETAFWCTVHPAAFVAERLHTQPRGHRWNPLFGCVVLSINCAQRRCLSCQASLSTSLVVLLSSQMFYLSNTLLLESHLDWAYSMLSAAFNRPALLYLLWFELFFVWDPNEGWLQAFMYHQGHLGLHSEVFGCWTSNLWFRGYAFIDLRRWQVDFLPSPWAHGPSSLTPSNSYLIIGLWPTSL